jgi:PAS domain S-box-containing protein
MRNYPFRIAFIYFAMASVWIFTSDWVTEQLVSSRYLTTVQSVKGFAFVIISSFVIFLVSRRYYSLTRKSERNYRKLFKENPHPMYVFDTETLKFLTVNDAAIAKYGYSYDEFRNMTMLDIRPPEERNAVIMFVKSLGDTPYHESGIWKHQDKKGEVFYVRIASHLANFDEHKARVVLVVDINEQIQAEQKLKDVAWIQSHEVRKPLANIMGILSLIRTETDKEQLAQLVSHMEVSCYELDNIIRKIVETSITEKSASTQA